MTIIAVISGVTSLWGLLVKRVKDNTAETLSDNLKKDKLLEDLEGEMVKNHADLAHEEAYRESLKEGTQNASVQELVDFLNSNKSK